MEVGEQLSMGQLNDVCQDGPGQHMIRENFIR